MATGEDSRFIHRPDPENPGWWTWDLADEELFNAFLGPIRIKPPGDDGVALVRMLPERRHANLGGVVHGGTTLAFMDIALFAGGRMLGIELAGRALTVDLQAHFTGAGRIGEPMIAEMELVRETRSLAFLRGLVMQQGDHVVASFSGLIKKVGPKE